MSQAQRQNIHIAFVDPFSSVQYLATGLQEAGIKISVIYTIDSLTSNYISLRPELFDHAFFLKDIQDLPRLIQELKSFEIDRVYYGSEFSVAIADQMAQELCPAFSNSVDTSSARFDKFEMQEKLRSAGIPCVKQIKIFNQIESEQEKELSNWSFPVVVKPINSVASIGVQICASLDEIKKYLQTQLSFNICGQSIGSFVIQEFLSGEEFFIDTFSCQGEHILSGIQKYKRVLYNQRPLGFYSEIIEPSNAEAVVCRQYIESVLSAIGLLNGLAHTEFMLTAKGPYLIEVNPRISGANGFNNKLFAACGYPTQVELLAASCQSRPYPVAKQTAFGRKVLLYNFKERAIGDLNISLLQKLPSFKDALMVKAPGTVVPEPKNLADVVAFVLLAHPDPMQIEKDSEQILSWEKSLELF